MKALVGLIAFVAGVVIAAVVCSVLNGANDALRQVHLQSDVYFPLRQCLDDIAQTQDRDPALAQQKVRLLRQRWSEYMDGRGRAPEQFADEVTRLNPSTTQTVRDPR
jgi:hypothetical protein